MNGPQDLGGQMGFGPVAPEPDEPLFHAGWEPRVLGLTLACAALGHWGIDESRHARESIPPADYLRFSYYRIWFTALCALLERHGEVVPEELALAKVLAPPRRAERCLPAERVPAVLAAGGPTERAVDRPARFAVGDTVRARVMHPKGHTRLPRYVRGAVGRVGAVHGAHVFPDAAAHGQGEAPEWLYTVAFAGADLWGPEAEPGLVVSVDAWEPYLERA
ncbi:nitrile hydratase subunit beta [Algicella marina]|uniref:Nitrile hydratase subunit beta n=1 Tax=Algicella marina TaxID=2683284 RepID=A0A6P1T353_9RHOB|nr:nitrile hydratase subunit beta [Algicella marina]QHQ35739.1 nitrile hydratase subunit beta [Algicella marina]